VGRLVVHDRVDRDDDVVLRDHLLRGDIDDLLTHVDEPQVLDERDDDAKPGVDRLLVAAEPPGDASLERPDDSNARRHEDEQQQRERCEHDDGDHDGLLAPHVVGMSLVPGGFAISSTGQTITRVPWTSMTRALVPAGNARPSRLSAPPPPPPPRTSACPRGAPR